MIKRVLAMILVGLALTGMGTASEYGASVSPFRESPVMDGTINPGEWDGALRIPAVMNYRNDTLVPYHNEVYFGFDKDNIYFAIVSELPPDGELLAKQTSRNSSDMIWDDGIEIFIDPNRQNRADGKGDRRFYGYHGNSVGAILDMAYDIVGAPDTGWNANWVVANAIHEDQGVWIQELSLPVADLGLESGEVIGRDMGILVARNIKRGVGWQQCPWFPHNEAFVSVNEYPFISLTKNAPTVSIDSFGGLDLHKGPIKLDARIFNPGQARQVKVKLHIESSTMPELDDEKVIDLPANGVAEYSYYVTGQRLHEDAEHNLALQVTSIDGEETYLNYMANWTKAPENRWPGVVLGPQPDKATTVEYYPTFNLLRLRVEPEYLELEDCSTASYSITTSRGVVLFENDLRWDGTSGEVELELPYLLDDVYTVTLNVPGWDKPLVSTFERKHFVWEGNKIGITDKVLSPFKPIKVKGDAVDVVLRNHLIDGLGLWKSVKAAGNVSAGGPRELLAAPMNFVVDGKDMLEGQGEFIRIADHEVVYEGHAEHPAVNVKTLTTTEIDGCMKVELILEPGKSNRKLQSLQLDIPLVDDLMPLYHVSTTSLRSNPAGSIPQGEGKFWDSRDFPDGSWYGNFKPYIWLGAEERGLAWFADNDAGWVLNVDLNDPEKSTPSIELIREDGVLTLRINLVQKPIMLDEPRKIVFGLMASPGKPMREDWRTLETAWMGSQYWGSDEKFAARYPRNADLSPLDMMMTNRLGEAFDFAPFLETWSKRNFGSDNPPHRKSKEQMQKLLEVSYNLTQRMQQGVPFTVYWEEFHSTSGAHPERQVFRHEWGGKSTRPIVESYRDFAVWWGAEFVRRGMGLYFDNSFPMQAFDPLTTSAYRLPNGQIQPSAGIWARREYLKRIWTIHELWGDPRMPPLMMIHMTNTHILPYMVWNHSNLDLEWFYGDSPVQARYSRDMLRVQTLGRQTGNIPFALARGSTPRKTRDVPNREEMFTIFEFKDPGSPLRPEYMLEFGYGQDDCDVFNYWDDGYPIRFSDPEVASILLRRGDKARLLLLTWNGSDAKVTLTPDAQKLGFKVSRATDVRAGKQLDVNSEGGIVIELEGYGARLIDLEGNQ